MLTMIRPRRIVESLVIAALILANIVSSSSEQVCEDDGNNNDNEINHDDNGDGDDKGKCVLYTATTTTKNTKYGLGLYAGIGFVSGSFIGPPQTAIPLLDVDIPLWRERYRLNSTLTLTGTARSVGHRSTHALLPSVGSILQCDQQLANVNMEWTTDYSDANRTSSTDVDMWTFRFKATHDIKPGEQLFIRCPNDTTEPENSNDGMTTRQSNQYTELSLSHLEKDGICIDAGGAHLSNQDDSSSSNNNNNSRNVANTQRPIAAQRFSKGKVVAISAVYAFDRHDLRIPATKYLEPRLIWSNTDQTINERSDGIGDATTSTESIQPLIENCFVHKESVVALFPTGPSLCRMRSSSDTANVAVRWATYRNDYEPDATQSENPHDFTPNALIAEQPDLFIEYVALRDIAMGEELILESMEGPKGLFPTQWFRQKPLSRSEAAFIETPLPPNGIRQVRWSDTGEPVSEYAWEVGLHSNFTDTMLSFAKDIGVIDAFRDVLLDGYNVPAGNERDVVLNGHNFYIQRPHSQWQSNMHWISPRDDAAYDRFLRALGAAGFDGTIRTIGQHFGFDSLVAYHLSFMALTHREGSYIHVDFTKVNGNAFNVIVPLELVDGSGPELEMQDDDNDNTQKTRVGLYNYQNHVATVIGNDMLHGTATCDYRDQREIRLAVSVFLAHLEPSSAEAIFRSYVPPETLVNMTTLPYTLRSRHWKAKDPSVRLPGPLLLNDVIHSSLSSSPGTVQPVTWKNRRWSIPNVYHVGLPTDADQSLLRFAADSGVVARLQSAVVGVDQSQAFSEGSPPTNNPNWHVQKASDESNLHALQPSDESTFFRVLQALSGAGFDRVLKGIGTRLGLNSLSVYDVAFLGVNHYKPSKGTRWTVKRFGPNIFEFIIPLTIVPDVGPEVLIQVDDPSSQNRAYLKQQLQSAYMFGDGVITSVAPHDYSIQQSMNMALLLRLADISSSNIRSVVATIGGTYPPRNVESFREQGFAGAHWNRTDHRVRLPVDSLNHTAYWNETMNGNGVLSSSSSGSSSSIVDWVLSFFSG